MPSAVACFGPAPAPAPAPVSGLGPRGHDRPGVQKKDRKTPILPKSSKNRAIRADFGCQEGLQGTGHAFVGQTGVGDVGWVALSALSRCPLSIFMSSGGRGMEVGRAEVPKAKGVVPTIAGSPAVFSSMGLTTRGMKDVPWVSVASFSLSSTVFLSASCRKPA